MTGLRWAVCVAVLVQLSACGGGGDGRSGSPTPPLAPTPPAPPWTVSGTVVATASQSPLGGVRVESFIATATTDGAGRFTLTAQTGPAANLGITVSTNGYRSRETVIGFPRTGEPFIDLVSTAPPFSETFYNQLARDALDEPDKMYQLYRWDRQLQFYLKTIDETLRPASPDVLAVVRQGIRDGVRYFSGGRYEAIIEEGTADRPERSGWINVVMLQEIPEGDYCGLATTVGGNPMTIKLRIDRCGCGSIKIPPDVVQHEVGHAMGLFHVSGKDHIMNRNVDFGCRPVLPSALEQYHAALMYARPRGNRDPDRDPAGFTLLRPDGDAGAPGRP